MYVYPYDAEYLWHVVSCMLFDDGYDLSKLFEEVLPHSTVTCADDAQKGGHHLDTYVRTCKLGSRVNDNL